MIGRSNARWSGNGREGKGLLSSASGVLAEARFGYRSRFEDGPGTNPEELLAAAHAACFTMAVAFGLQAAGFTASQLDTEAAVALEPDGEALRIKRSVLTLRADVPGLDEARFQEIATAAKRDCPVSRALDAEISLTATLSPH